MSEIVRVEHLRQILLWPVHIQSLPTAEAAGAWQPLGPPAPGNPWHEVDDEFGEPAEFQERHYNEFITFLPPVQRFLYGEGLGRAVKRTYGESPIKVMRRGDIRKARVWLEEGSEPILVSIAHVDLYFFVDIDIAILALEVFANGLPLDVAQDFLFRFGRAYPAYWEEGGRAGHCPWRVEWIGAEDRVLAVSDYERREKYLSFVCAHRAPNIAAHWEFLMGPLVLEQSDRKGGIRFRQLEYHRMPFMVLLALECPERLSRSDRVRLALGTPKGDSLPYSAAYLESFEARFCYDRYAEGAPDGAGAGVRFMATGHTLVTIGASTDAFFMSANGGILGRFRHQHFLMFLIAHFQKAGLRMFADQLVAMVSRLDAKDPESNRRFRNSIRGALERFLRFAQRAWFHEISNQAQVRELFALTRRHLELEPLYNEVREELQDMGSFLDVEAMRRQNETVVRLTVVTTFGLIGTVTTGVLGMNLLAWADEPPAWRLMALLLVLVPTMLLTLVTVMKSRRLSEFLDSLSDEQASLRQRMGAFARIWWRG